MSGVSGKVREGKEFIKETGFFEGKVIAINPDREQLEKILGTTLEKDPEYLSEDENNVTKLSIVVWLRDVDSDKVKSIRFYLKDKERVSAPKEGETRTVKKQFINTIGSTSWAENADKLLDWFKAREFRVAHEGEEELYNFIVHWLNKLDIKDAKAALSFDWKKLMRGNVRELTEQIGGEYEGTVTCLCTIKEVEKDGERKTYEQVYNKEFLAGYSMKEIRAGRDNPAKRISQEFIDRANATERKKRTKLQKFVLNVTDNQYGIKDYYTLGELEPYDPGKNPAAGNKSHIIDDDTSY